MRAGPGPTTKRKGGAQVALPGARACAYNDRC